MSFFSFYKRAWPSWLCVSFSKISFAFTKLKVLSVKLNLSQTMLSCHQLSQGKAEEAAVQAVFGESRHVWFNLKGVEKSGKSKFPLTKLTSHYYEVFLTFLAIQIMSILWSLLLLHLLLNSHSLLDNLFFGFLSLVLCLLVYPRSICIHESSLFFKWHEILICIFNMNVQSLIHNIHLLFNVSHPILHSLSHSNDLLIHSCCSLTYLMSASHIHLIR